MSTRNLESLFDPKSIAVVGASDTPGSVGAVVMKNLKLGGYTGRILAVNPRHASVANQPCFPSVNQLPYPPSLAVICTPPAEVPGIVSALGECHTRAAIVLTAGTVEGEGASLSERVAEAARTSGIRVLGPNCIGLVVPQIGLNATFAHAMALPGHLAFVSQSGALCTAVLDWTLHRGIGLSHLVSLGNSADVDVADVLDYLGGLASVRGILLYIESITNARKFMSAARAAARNKPLIAIKAGRFDEGAAAAATHTGALAGADDVFDAAFRRAGILRVFEIDDLFGAVETLARARPVLGNRLAIVTNGGGPGVMATDALIAGDGRLAAFQQQTMDRLNAALPQTWSHANPVDIIGDAGPDRYRLAVEAVLQDDLHDAVLVMNVPTALASSQETAQVVADIVRNSSHCVFAAWMGGAEAAKARACFDAAGVPMFDTPDRAVRAFLQMFTYRRNQELLIQTPTSMPDEVPANIELARHVISRALETGRNLLNEPESKQLIAAFGIPVIETVSVATAEEAAAAARRLGFPVAIKICSRDITHKSEVGGVELTLTSTDGVLEACRAIRERVSAALPRARLDGFTVQKMVPTSNAYELILGAKTDPIFGPVLLFGEGGTAVEVVRDRAVCLPPLNRMLAADLVSRTRIFRKLRGYRNRPGVDLETLYTYLIRATQIVVELPEVDGFDINPLVLSPQGAIAVDARVSLARTSQTGVERLAIRPYPRELQEVLTINDGMKVLARPIRPEDESGHQEFFSRLKSEDAYFRFFGLVREFPHSEMARYTQIDYDREMAFIAVGMEGADAGRTLGVVRAVSNSQHTESEFGIIVRSDLKGHGLGRALLEKMIRYCKATGQAGLTGLVIERNRAMLALAHDLGFVHVGRQTAGEVEIRLDLRDAPTAGRVIGSAGAG